jgi:SAM-dependent methyltransferase
MTINNKQLKSLKEIFATDDIVYKSNRLKVNDKVYPVIDDVIILLSPDQYTDYVREELQSGEKTQSTHEFSKNIQYSFGEEWKEYGKILPEHKTEFKKYFDIVNLNNLTDKRVCDLGCGIGRWSYFLKDICREIVLVDFSDAIFTARKNLKGVANCLFFMGDLKNLPFKNNFCDFLFSLGVLHHLPTDCIMEVKNLKKYAPQLLIFLYYALDNRPLYFKLILKAVTALRKLFSKIKSQKLRTLITSAATYSFYIPAVYLGKLLQFAGLGSYIPLYDFYHDKSIKRIKQDVYDRFFTSIEQRVSRNDIRKLKPHFSKLEISKDLPYWHFLCTG